MKTGALIKHLRVKKGMTQEELAARTDISVRTIQRIENGEVDPRAYTLQSIASALEVNFEELTVGEVDNGQGTKIPNTRWLGILHLSGLLLLVVPPIFIWLWKRERVASMDGHAYDIINFQISMTLYLVPCLLFSIYPFLVLLIVYSQVIIIMNTVRVTNNQTYKYPLSIRFLRLKAVA